MKLYLHPVNPEARLVKQLADRLKKGELLVLPTDTVYAFVTLAQSKDSVAQIQRIKDLPKNKALTLYCRDFSQMSTYVRSQGNQLFRFMKNILPGPYTLIFDAAKSLPHYAVTNDKGEFFFKSLAPGKYKMKAWSERTKEPLVKEILIKRIRGHGRTM